MVVVRSMLLTGALASLTGCSGADTEKSELEASRDQHAAVRRSVARLAQIQFLDATLALTSESLRDAIGSTERSALALPGESAGLRELERLSHRIRGRLLLARASATRMEGRRAFGDVLEDVEALARSLEGRRGDLGTLGSMLGESVPTLHIMLQDLGELRQ